MKACNVLTCFSVKIKLDLKRTLKLAFLFYQYQQCAEAKLHICRPQQESHYILLQKLSILQKILPFAKAKVLVSRVLIIPIPIF